MLGKLLKYEIKATARTFIPLYIALLIFALINRFSFANHFINNTLRVLPVISATVYTALIVAIFVITFLVMIQRFYRNLLSDEGYLMFTLPVKSSSHIWAKTITSLLWILASGFVTFLSVLILAADAGWLGSFWSDLQQMMTLIHLELGLNGYLFLIEFFLLLLTSVWGGIVMIYFCISIGHRFSSHRLLAAFGTFLGFNVILQLLFSIFGHVGIQVFHIDQWLQNMEAISASHTFLLGSILINLVIGIFCFLVTNNILTKKLNLD